MSLPQANVWLDPDQRPPRTVMGDRALAWTLAGVLIVVYLFVYTGVIQSSDGLAMFATAESMVRRGEIDSNQLLWMGAQQGNLGPDGELYSRKGLGMTVLALPLMWLATLWPGIGLVQTALLLNPILTAWTGALLFLTGRRLHWSRPVAAVTALLFGVATLALPYTQTFFSDPVCMWGLFAGGYGLLAHAQTGRKRYLFGAGLGWSIAYLARVVNLITLPLYLAGLVVVIRYAAVRPPTRATLAGLAVWLWRDAWRPLISFGIPVVLAGLASLYWNWARYGSIWDSGYVETERFDAVWWFGVSGLLAGPARGFFWYSPILLLGFWGIRRLWRHQRGVALFSALLSIVYIALYGKWYMWHGGYSWGPRFLVPILPFVALYMGAALVGVAQRNSPILKWAVGALALLSLAVQILGSLIPFRLVQDWLDANVQPLFAPETFTRLEYSPLLRQWDFLHPQNWQIFWLAPSTGWNWQLGLLLAYLLVLLIGGGLLVRQLATQNSAPAGERARGDLSADIWEAAARPYTLAVIIAVFLVLVVAFRAPDHMPHREIAARIAASEQSGDAVVHLIPESTQHFANVYKGALPVYGLREAGTLDEPDSGRLEYLRSQSRRIWVITASASAEQSAWERTLRGEDFLLYEFRPPGADVARLALFASAPGHALQEAGLGTIFGDPQSSPPITAETGWIRLSGYGFTAETHTGGELLLALRWEALQSVPENYHVFVHLLDQEGDRLAQRDGQPVQWLRPTSTWQPGEEIIDRYGLLLSPDIAPGEYTLAVGLYHPVTGQRLPVSAGPSSYAIELGPIVVRPSP